MALALVGGVVVILLFALAGLASMMETKKPARVNCAVQLDKPKVVDTCMVEDIEARGVSGRESGELNPSPLPASCSRDVEVKRTTPL